MALKALASATGSSRAQLIGMGSGLTMFNWVTDADQSHADDFVEIEGHRPDVNYRVATSGAPFDIVWERHYDAARAGHNFDIYLDYVRQWDAEDGAHTVLASSADSFVGLASLHAPGDGRTTAAQRRVLRDAAPHVLDAIRLQQSIEHRGMDLLRGSLDAVGSAAILIDSTGRVCAMTDAAERMLGPDGLQVRDGMLRAVRPAIDRGLQKRIAFALAGSTNLPELWMRQSAMPVLVKVHPLPGQDWNFGFAPQVMVSLRTPLGTGDGDGERMSAAFSLTPAEGEIVALLAQGHSRRDIAAIREVSTQTVASQLRTIFQKCDVNREAELVSIARAVIEMATR